MSTEESIKAYLEKKISRREFTERLTALGVTAGAAFVFAEALTNAQGAQLGGVPNLAHAPRALNPAEFKAVEAMAGRIVPATDTPGAIEAGAADYITIALAEPYRPQLARYQRGLAELDMYCRGALAKTFAELTPAQQDGILENLEAGKIGEVADGAQFFETVRRHVMEGFFCEPYYGGNKDLIGWKLVGFPGQRYGYDEAYINKRIDLPPIAGNFPPRKGA